MYQIHSLFAYLFGKQIWLASSAWRGEMASNTYISCSNICCMVCVVDSARLVLQDHERCSALQPNPPKHLLFSDFRAPKIARDFFYPLVN